MHQTLPESHHYLNMPCILFTSINELMVRENLRHLVFACELEAIQVNRWASVSSKGMVF
jgi:hypothetical protein